MLILSRKVGESIAIGDNINIVVNRIAGNRVAIGIKAPNNVRVVRGELERFVDEFGSNVTFEAFAGSKLDAVQRAGAGTGGALVLSAITSVLGFLVMALAPMPMFQMFGVLTAVAMISAMIADLTITPAALIFFEPMCRTKALAPGQAQAPGQARNSSRPR